MVESFSVNKNNSNYISPYNNCYVNIDKTFIDNYDIQYDNNLEPVLISGYDNNELNHQILMNNHINCYYSSVTGTYENNNYKLNIFYNASIPDALPNTFDGLASIILRSYQFESKEYTSKLINFNSNQPSLSLNYKYILMSNHLSSILLNFIFIACSSYLSSYIVKERMNQHIKQLQLNGISKIWYFISSIAVDSLLQLFVYFFIMYILGDSNEFLLLVIFIFLLLLW